MFTILKKDVDGRVTNRYFKVWENAEFEIECDANRVRLMFDVISEETLNYFNSSKGFTVYETIIHCADKVTKEMCRFKWSLINGYFED